LELAGGAFAPPLKLAGEPTRSVGPLRTVTPRRMMIL
jgi:hypothetical protein